MRVLLYGGDERTVLLAQLLLSDGNEVSCFALDEAELPDGALSVRSVTAADCVILPVPCTENGLLKAPFSRRPHELTEILPALCPGTLLCGGRLPEKLVSAALKKGALVSDILTDPAFTVGNADITAEAAVRLLASELRKTLFESRVLIVGCGRIAKLLSAKLRALGAEVCVMSRSAQSRELARAMGISAMPPDAPASALSGFDAAVNTAPAPFSAPHEGFNKGCFLLELASYPYGFDADKAAELGLRYKLASGLPGKYAPESAAGLIFRVVNNKVRELCNGRS